MFDSSGTRGPGDPYLHSYRPSRPVWVFLALAYPVADTTVRVPGAVDLQAIVPGTVHMRTRIQSGHWIFYVTFRLPAGFTGGTTVHSQWVLADAVRPRRADTEPL